MSNETGLGVVGLCITKVDQDMSFLCDICKITSHILESQKCPNQVELLTNN